MNCYNINKHKLVNVHMSSSSRLGAGVRSVVGLYGVAICGQYPGYWLVGVGVLVISDMNSDEAESRAGAGPGQGSTGLQCYYGAPLLPPSLVIQHA